jgi:hypothetical protein
VSAIVVVVAVVVVVVSFRFIKKIRRVVVHLYPHSRLSRAQSP